MDNRLHQQHNRYAAIIGIIMMNCLLNQCKGKRILTSGIEKNFRDPYPGFPGLLNFPVFHSSESGAQMDGIDMHRADGRRAHIPIHYS